MKRGWKTERDRGVFCYAGHLHRTTELARQCDEDRIRRRARELGLASRPLRKAEPDSPGKEAVAGARHISTSGNGDYCAQLLREPDGQIRVSLFWGAECVSRIVPDLALAQRAANVFADKRPSRESVEAALSILDAGTVARRAKAEAAP